jgi:hypothetical protein
LIDKAQATKLWEMLGNLQIDLPEPDEAEEADDCEDEIGESCMSDEDEDLVPKRKTKTPKNKSKQSVAREIQVSTVDAFQGAEKGECCLSC